ncbi:Dihydrofolate reductase [Dictyocoela muelleri]|nr:Dihydrofolate reductase [Dictyocoela muelleri]
MLKLSENKVNIVVAYSRNKQYIGKNCDLPWGRKISGDLKFISFLTKYPDVGVIMGRRTFESIKKPLPGRVNIVISSKPFDNAIVVHSYEEAIGYCKEKNLKIVIFGGTKVYEKALKFGNYKMFCTIVDYDGDGDTFFPSHDTELHCVSKDVKKILVDGRWTFKDDEFLENGLKYKFYIGEK